MTEEKYRVLILDDDYELGELLREYLQNTRKCAVTYVLTEEDFWACLRNENFDILFLDYKMPEANGLDILNRMGQAGYTIPTVMMTGEGSENIAARAIQLGALDYLVKGEYAFSSLPPLIQKAVRLREMQRAMQQYLEQVRYQAMLLDNMRDAVVVWGLDGTITYWNAAAEQLYGAPAAERLGRRVQEVYFPGFEPTLQLDPASQTGHMQVEHRFLLPTGEKMWVSTHITALYHEDNRGEPIGYMNVARDITPRKLEQEALIKSQHFIKRILDTSPNIIYILNLRSRRIRYINPEVKAILGYPVEEFTNAAFTRFTNYIHPEDMGRLEQHLNDLARLKNGEALEIEYRLLSHKQEWRWLRSRETIFSRGEAGAAAEIIGVMQDITASKLAEEKLQRRLLSEKLLSTISNHFINLEHPETDQGVEQAMRMVGEFLRVDYGLIGLLNEEHLALYFAQPLGADMPVGTEHERPTPVTLTPAAAAPSNHDSPAGYLPHASGLVETLRRQGILTLDISEDAAEEARLGAPGSTTAASSSGAAASSSGATAPLGRARQALSDPQDPLRELLARQGLRSAVLIPMVFNNALYGVLGFGASQAGLRWNEDDLYVLKTLSEMLTNALVQKQIDQALRISEARYRAIVEEHQTEMICRFLPDTTLTFVNEAYCNYYGLERGLLVGTSFLAPLLEDQQEPVRAQLATLSTENPIHLFQQQVRLPDGQVRWQEWVGRAIFDQHNDFIEYQAVGRDITERKAMEEQIKAAQTHLTQATRLSSIGELASGVAHQISNPLTTIIADAQILQHELGHEHPGRESAAAIVDAGWRAQQVINELMKFSQPAQASAEPVSINETIQTALLLASAHIQAAGVRLDVQLQPELPEISGNPRQLTDLWVNLLLLARSAFRSQAEHRIAIQSHSANGREIWVEVTDNGQPIPSDQYEKIFEPQLLPSGEGRGTGMELSLCREIVRQNRGQISVSGNGRETTFHIMFSIEGSQV